MKDDVTTRKDTEDNGDRGINGSGRFIETIGAKPEA